MDPEGQLRNLRDFLLVYNRMTESCFKRCTSNFNYRNLTMDEERCADSCAGKLIRSNHRIMGTYVQLMPAMVQRRMEEMESKAAEIPKATEAGESVEPLAGGLKSTDTSSAFATAPPGVPTPTSAAEQAGSLASNGTFRSTPTLATNEKLGSPDHTISFVTESTNTDDPPAIVSSLGMKEGLKVSAPPVNSSVTSPSSATADIQLRTVAAHHIGVVNSSISPPASAHQSTDGEGPPS